MNIDFQIDREEDDDKIWWEDWDRRRRMAVAQAVCNVAHAVYILRAHYELDCEDESVMLENERKRKARTWERRFESVKEVVNDVREAIKEGNGVVERSRRRIYTEREAYAELVKIGVERELTYTAYVFFNS
ncbi:hypothetical protein M5689_005701 [Euphorbia peplus]|nr:hypothetical protein M5689_005701 [Euphorbia peplus]